MAYIPSREFFETHPRFKGLTLEEAQERYGAYLRDKCVRNPHLTLEAAQEHLMKEFKQDFKLQGSATGRLSSPRIEPHIIRPSELRNHPGVQTLIDRAIHDLSNHHGMEARRIMLEGDWDVSPFENKHTTPVVDEIAKRNAIHFLQYRLGLPEADIEPAPEPESLYPDGHDDPMAAIRDMCK